jgi:DNA-binding CsgD family transcriptional regulator
MDALVRVGGLTKREAYVLACAELGHANKLIAHSLEVSKSTAATLLERAHRKLGSAVRSPEAMQTLTCTRRAFLVPLAPVREAPAANVLTEAEQAVTELVLDGFSNAAIARERRCSPRTIANQLSTVYRKLGICGRRELRAKFGR